MHISDIGGGGDLPYMVDRRTGNRRIADIAVAFGISARVFRLFCGSVILACDRKHDVAVFVFFHRFVCVGDRIGVIGISLSVREKADQSVYCVHTVGADDVGHSDTDHLAESENSACGGGDHCYFSDAVFFVCGGGRIDRSQADCHERGIPREQDRADMQAVSAEHGAGIV